MRNMHWTALHGLLKPENSVTTATVGVLGLMYSWPTLDVCVCDSVIVLHHSTDQSSDAPQVISEASPLPARKLKTK